MNRFQPKCLAAPAALAVAGVLSGCVSPHVRPDGNYAATIGGSQVTANPSPYSAALVCMAKWGEAHNVNPPTIAVGRINDLTGALDANGGRTITQGAMLMAITALGKAGVPVVERYETDVSKLEYALGNNKLIAPRPEESKDEDGPDYRPIKPGQVAAADYFITGGITELNANIRTPSAGLQMYNSYTGVTQGGPVASSYVLNVAIDLRMIDTQSLRVVDMISYQKQVIGRQVGANLYAFFGNNLLSANASVTQDEPTHLAVRALVERAVLEMVSNLYGAPSPDVCLSPEADVMRGKVIESSNP